MIRWALFSILAAGALYLLYLLLFRHEKQFQVRRCYLLSALVFSLLYPLIPSTVIGRGIHGQTEWIELPTLVVGADNALTTENTAGISEGQPIADVAQHIPVIVYLCGVALTLAWLIVVVTQALVKVARARRSARSGAGHCIMLDDDTQSYSFFHYIIIGSRAMNDKELACVLAHEQEHARRRHTLDVLTMRLMCCIAWFNPFAWLMQKELRAVHEYQADAAVTECLGEKAYLGLLYKQATGIGYGHITHNFQSINLKKRITMMKQEKSRFGAWKALAALPVAALLMMVGCKPSTNSEADATAAQPQEAVANTNDTIYDGTGHPADVDPEFPGGMDELYKYLAQNIQYPEQAKQENIQGRVVISFVIEKDGSIAEVQVLRGIGGGCDEEALRVVNAMPKWTPGKVRGENVRVKYALPVTFKLQ